MKFLDHPAIDAMVDAVRAASRICRAVQEGISRDDAVTKDDRSPVTIADFASQAVVSRRLADAMPDLPLVGEETADLLREEENAAVKAAVVAEARKEWPDAAEADVLAAIDRGAADATAIHTFFTLDPIDGTKGFLRGDHYAVALALIEEGEVVAGVLGCPNLPAADGTTGAILVAQWQRGTFELSVDGGGEGEPVEVSQTADTTQVRFTESVEKAHSNKGRSAEVAAILGVTVPPVPIDSQVKYAVVARGDGELYLRIPRGGYVEKIWDHAAGSLVVREAGGTVTDIEGRPLDFSRGRTLERNRGIVASNGRVHDAVLEALAKTK
jgi:3'(2'), 5'-bisphosphate nucleotidase